MSRGAVHVLPPSDEVMPQALVSLVPGSPAPKNASSEPLGSGSNPGTDTPQSVERAVTGDWIAPLALMESSESPCAPLSELGRTKWSVPSAVRTNEYTAPP